MPEATQYLVVSPSTNTSCNVCRKDLFTSFSPLDWRLLGVGDDVWVSAWFPAPGPVPIRPDSRAWEGHRNALSVGSLASQARAQVSFDKGSSARPASCYPHQETDASNGFLLGPGGVSLPNLPPLLGLLPVTKRLALPRATGCTPAAWPCPAVPTCSRHTGSPSKAPPWVQPSPGSCAKSP